MKINPLITNDELQMLNEDMEFIKKVNDELLAESPNDEFGQAIACAVSKIEDLLAKRGTGDQLDLEQEVEFWAYATLLDNIMNSIVDANSDDFEDDDLDEDEDEGDDREVFSIEDFLPKK